jgi:MFS family permease
MTQAWHVRLRALPRPLRVLFLAMFVNRVGMFVFPLLAVYLVEGKGLDAGEAGLLLSLGSVGLLAGSLLSGPACVRWGRRWTLVGALLLNASGYLGLAVVRGAPGTYTAILFAALVGMGMFGPAANTLIADFAPAEQRRFAYTVSYMCNNLGMSVGPLLGGVVAAVSYSLMFGLDIGASVVVAVLLLLWVPGDRPRGAVAEIATPKRKIGYRSLGHGEVWLLLAASFFYVVPLIGLEYSVPLAVTTVLRESTGFVGVVYTVNSAVILGFGLVVEKFIARHSTKTLLVTAGLLWALGLALPVVAFSLAALLLCTVIWTLGEIIVSIVVPAYIADRVEEGRVPGFMAVNGFVLGLARLIVPAGLGALWQAQGHGPVFLVLLITPLVGVAACSLLRLPAKSPHTQETDDDEHQDQVPDPLGADPDDLVQRGPGPARRPTADAASRYQGTDH